MSWYWSEQQLAKALTMNPAIRINEKYSTPAAKKTGGPKVPRVSQEPMSFYTVEEPIRFMLPFTYPSLNKMMGANRYGLNRDKQQFVNDVRWYLKLWNIKGFRSKVELKAIIYEPVFRYRDTTDNYCYKWLADSLKGFVIIDDDPRYLVTKPAEFRKGKKKIEVLISPVYNYD